MNIAESQTETKTQNAVEDNQTEFVSKFKDLLEKKGFHGFTPFTQGVGFGVYKKLRDSDIDRVTLFRVGISDDNANGKLPLSAGASYGVMSDYGVRLRNGEEIFINDPVDMESRNDYFYDTKTKTLFKKDRQITPEELIDDIYNLHIKPTKVVRGFLLRIKLRIWRTWLPFIFTSLSNIFHYLLLIISGNRYTFEPFVEEEKINNEIISTKSTLHKVKEKESLQESKKFHFFDYEASRWSIVFYSLVHLALYSYFFYINYKPAYITTILENNFLIIIYVVCSLWMLESIIPLIFMFLIKRFSKLAFYSEIKNIEL